MARYLLYDAMPADTMMFYARCGAMMFTMPRCYDDADLRALLRVCRAMLLVQRKRDTAIR